MQWPFGYTARVEIDRIVLVDDSGTAIAREGDEVEMGGGFGDVLFIACGGVRVVTPAP